MCADHVVIEGHAAGLAMRLFGTLDLERVSCELALAAAEDDLYGRALAGEELEQLERAARRHGVLFSRPGNGAGHRVYLERFSAPGRLVLGTSPGLAACGALGALAIVVSPCEAAAALAGAAVEVPWVESRVVRLYGKPPAWLSGEDVGLEMSRRFSVAPPGGVVLEFQTTEPQALPFHDRVTLASRSPGWGAAGALFHADEVTRGFLKAQGREADWKPLGALDADRDARGLELDFSDLEPLVRIAQSGAVLRLRELGDAEVSAVWIGPEASLADLERLAVALSGGRVADGVELRVTLGGRQARETAVRAGWIAALRAAGAKMTAPPSIPPRPRAGGGLSLACGAPRAGAAGWHETGIGACAAAVLAGRVTDPRQHATSVTVAVPESYAIDDRLIERPGSGPADREGGKEADPLPRSPGIRGPLRGAVLIKLGDHVGVDGILPWGARVRPLAHRIEELSRFAFAGTDADFAARARREGSGWVVAGRQLGAGPRREEAALVAVALGVRGILARSFDPGFRRMLRQHGLLGLRFASEGDLDGIAAGDELEIPDLPEGLEPGKPLVVRNLTQGSQYTLHHDLDESGVQELRGGGMLQCLRRSRAAA